MSNRYWIDAKSTPEEGRARWIRGWGPGGVKRSQKDVPGPPGLECQKSVEKVPNDPKRSQKEHKLEGEELGPWRLGGVRLNPSFFWIRAIFPYKNREIQFWTLVRVKRSKSLWPKFFQSKQNECSGTFVRLFWNSGGGVREELFKTFWRRCENSCIWGLHS